MTPICTGCNKRPEEIEEYCDPNLLLVPCGGPDFGDPAACFCHDNTAPIPASRLCSHCGCRWQTPSEFVLEEEGTLNPANGHFKCTACYIAIGMPSLPHPRRWMAM